jgi:glycosyltransferase involved in cell wall biosynthesis
MRIGIDVRYLSHGLVGGIHTYLLNFIPALMEAAREHEIFLYADHKREFELSGLPGNASLRLLPYQGPVSSAWGDFMIGNQMGRDGLDVAHFPANYGLGPRSTRVVITLHDEINILPLKEIYRGHKKDARTLAMMTYLHFWTSASVKKADAIVTVSDYSKRKILDNSRLKPEQIFVIPHACPGEVERVTNEGELEKYRLQFDIRKPFILADGLKNPAVLWRAWQSLPAELQAEYELIFFARRPDVIPVIHEAVDAGQARFLLRPSRRELNALFSLCHTFVFPSWIEGFGLPLIEAMTCGAPIIASDRGSIPEVVEKAAWLMDAEDDAALAGYLQKIMTLPEERQKLQQAGFERVKFFSWARIARMALEVYSENPL